MAFKRPGPLAQMTLGLVTMTVSIMLLADLLLGLSPNQDRQRQVVRQQLSESLAAQAAAHLQADDEAALERTLREVARRVSDVRSAGVRREDGVLVAAVGPHEQAWHLLRNARDGAERTIASTADNVRVPLSANGRAWGAVEIAYVSESAPWWLRIWQSPLLHRSLFMGLVGALGYALYLRRALQHLDPSSVIPDRVQRAFDSMAEGVVVLDARARVMLANRAFRTLAKTGGDTRDAVRIGQPLSTLPWLSASLASDPGAHPWARAMADQHNIADEQILIKAGDGDADGADTDRRVIVSCAPITDNGGAVRGCITTFNDMTEMHRANVALKEAMLEIEAGREELRRNNIKLQDLATRDALTGCLNRRAFMDSASEMLAAAAAAATGGKGLGCLMLDIDHFKGINDNHGHGVGDRVIAEVARIMMQSVRAGDLVCRYGGEEFCIVANELPAAALVALAERIRSQIARAAGAKIGEVNGLQITISIGAEMTTGDGDTLPALIDRADQALYRAKRSGRNRVVQFTSVDPADATEPA